MAIKRIEPGIKDTSLVTTVNKNYRDVDLTFGRKVGTEFSDGVQRGDIYKKIDIRAVEQSMKNILLTNFYEKPFQPFFGSDLRRMLFELDTMVSESDIDETIRFALRKWEPRVRVDDVEIFDPGAERMVPKGSSDVFLYADSRGDAQRHTLIVTVYATIRNTGQEIATRINMNRLR